MIEKLEMYLQYPVTMGTVLFVTFFFLSSWNRAELILNIKR